jgi:tetratricopeptide (TPR) repeat protein
MKFFALACVLLGLALPAAAHADVGNRSPLEIEFDQLSAAIARDDCSEGLSLTRRITERGMFKGFPDQARGAIWTFAALCADKKGLYGEALADARNASAVPGATASIWSLRFSEAVKAKQLDDVPTGVEALAHTAPGALNALPVGAFRQFETDAVAAGRPDLAMRTYAVLEAANYAPANDGWGTGDQIWVDYAGLAADAGDARHAAALLSRVSLTRSLILAKLDGRFAAEVAADPARFDLKAAALRQLERDRAEMLAHPDRLIDVRAVVIDPRGLGRFDEALALDQAAVDRIAQAPRAKPAFTDQDTERNWLYEGRAETLKELGRFDEALTALRAAARLTETGGPNVSQAIDLAGYLNFMGRPADALTELAPFAGDRGVSPYGAGWVHAEHACALQRLGRAAEVAPDVAYLAAHERDNPGARLRGLMCTGSEDDLAADVIADLRDSAQREMALALLSDFDRPAPIPELDSQLAMLATIRARPDISAAIAAVGHTERIPLCECVYMDPF